MGGSLTYPGHPDQKWGCTSYAQHGDDYVILNLFHLMDIEKPSYLDLGAHHPFHISNTALLYQLGSRGVNIEANPNLLEAFQIHRPYDINVNAGVGPENGIRTFYMYSLTSGRNTFSYEETITLKGKLEIQETIGVKVIVLAAIIHLYCNGIYPDFLNCDLEGLDMDVLYQLPSYSMNSPKVICVETRKDQTDKMKNMICSKGYAYYCRMGENLFFIHKDFHQKVI